MLDVAKHILFEIGQRLVFLFALVQYSKKRIYDWFSIISLGLLGNIIFLQRELACLGVE